MAFFSELQNWFIGGFDGRYIGKIIFEWQKEDRAGFRAFIHKQLDLKLPLGYRLEAEFSYKPGSERRAADLAIFSDDYSAVPIVLIEIKWNDNLIEDRKTGRAQLTDYVQYCLEHKACNLLVLTKDSLLIEDLSEIGKLISRGHHCYFGSLFSVLDESNSGIAKMLLDFLQDKGVIVNNIDSKALFQFFHRFVNPYKGSNHKVSDGQLSSGPDQFKNLLNNMRLVAQDISPQFYELKGINRKATVDFTIYPSFSKVKLEKAIKLLEDNEFTPEPSARTGGEILVHAVETICKSPSTKLEYGLCFSVEPDKLKNLSVSVYALINGAKINWEETRSSQGGAVVKKCIFDGKRKQELVKILSSEIKKAINIALEKKLVTREIAPKLQTIAESL